MRGLTLSSNASRQASTASSRCSTASAGSADDVLASRLALWGRRLVGEALGVVQTVLAAHPELLRLATVDPADADAGADRSPKLFGQLTAEHTRRMARLGLTA